MASAGKGHYLDFNLNSLIQEPYKYWEDAIRAVVGSRGLEVDKRRKREEGKRQEA